MRRVYKTLALFLFPKLKEILNSRDRLYKENIELKGRIEFLENSKNILLDAVVINSGNCSKYFSVKVFDSKNIPGKN